MSTKIKNIQTNKTNTTEQILSNIGLTALSLAAVITVTQLQHAKPHKSEHMQKSPIHSFVGQVEAVEAKIENKVKKEKDKIRHHTVTYGVHMRAPAPIGTS